jgi:hypothetical protein
MRTGSRRREEPAEGHRRGDGVVAGRDSGRRCGAGDPRRVLPRQSPDEAHAGTTPRTCGEAERVADVAACRSAGLTRRAVATVCSLRIETLSGWLTRVEREGGTAMATRDPAASVTDHRSRGCRTVSREHEVRREEPRLPRRPFTSRETRTRTRGRRRAAGAFLRRRGSPAASSASSRRLPPVGRRRPESYDREGRATFSPGPTSSRKPVG